MGPIADEHSFYRGYSPETSDDETRRRLIEFTDRIDVPQRRPAGRRRSHRSAAGSTCVAPGPVDNAVPVANPVETWHDPPSDAEGAVMENNAPKPSASGYKGRGWLRRLVTVIVGSALFLLSACVAAESAKAAEAHVKDRYGHSVRVPTKVIAKLSAKHNVTLVAVAAWLPRSKLQKAEGTRKEFHITIVKVQCETFPLVGRICWRTHERVVLHSIVDYRVNRQGFQQGLITAYCDGMVRCPSWVNRPRVASGGGRGGGGGGGW